jgi:hypothetical protein
MRIPYKIIIILLTLTALLTGVTVAYSDTSENWFVLDEFDDGQINTDLWRVSGGVAEGDGKLILSTDGQVRSLKKGLIGMELSAVCYQNIVPGQHVNFHLTTTTSTGDMIVLVIYRADGSPNYLNNDIACQWLRNGINLQHIVLQTAQWGTQYLFGLEYTQDGSVLVRINGQVVYSFAGVPGADIAYKEGATDFHFKNDSIEGGGSINAEIDWVKSKSATKKALPWMILLLD